MKLPTLLFEAAMSGGLDWGFY